MWSSKTKPTPANIRRRLDAAIDALTAATELVEKHDGRMKKEPVRKAIKQAMLWAIDAKHKAEAR